MPRFEKETWCNRKAIAMKWNRLETDVNEEVPSGGVGMEGVRNWWECWSSKG